MFKDNTTMVTDVIFMGFHNLKGINILIFVVLLVVYSLTLCGNLLIIACVYFCNILHTPMYFFLTQLSLCDIILSTDIAPHLLNVILKQGGTMSFRSCIVQYFFFAMAECSECLLLTVMSYDRYLAICNPLHYTVIMNNFLCLKLSIMSWMLGISTMMASAISIVSLNFCGPNVMDHFFCDVLPLLKLSCSSTIVVNIEVVIFSITVLFLPFLLIIVSYSCVIFTILKIPSATGKHKAFSTCSSHLTVVSIFYVTLICAYGLPNRGQVLNLGKILSICYTLGTPLMNPIIYSLRNKDIKIAFEKLINNLKVDPN
ncbi:olfactory receptor 11L1-like [Hyperolius riggenbachi]|uniref:olfactory receptor 11L1-like n=1 Tax=Hyperolius riggenbachi TaxID=752182 RepID=UPI0035A32C6F